MRKIVHRPGRHNTWPPTPVAAVVALVLLALLPVSGCGDGNEQAASDETAPAASSRPDCPVEIDTSAWEPFRTMAGRMAAGEAVPRLELEAWGDMPMVEAWRRTQAPHVPRTTNVANWLEEAWRAELGLTDERKLNANMVAFGRTFRYSHARADRIEDGLAAFASGGAACAVRDLALVWMPPERLPTPLRLVFLPAKPEVRIDGDAIFIDTGVLAAGGVEQTVRQIATLLFRNLEALPGPNPLERQGEAAVAEAFRVMMNEGVAAHIEQTLAIEFDADHPDLGKIHLVPEDFYRKAQQTADTFEQWLPAMFTDPATMTARGEPFARNLAGSNAYTSTGIAMASVIVARLGEAELQRVHRSVPDFLAAYQQAALQNPSPAPEPGAPGVTLAETVRPLPPAIFTPLHALLERHFGGD